MAGSGLGFRPGWGWVGLGLGQLRVVQVLGLSLGWFGLDWWDQVVSWTGVGSQAGLGWGHSGRASLWVGLDQLDRVLS